MLLSGNDNNEKRTEAGRGGLRSLNPFKAQKRQQPGNAEMRQLALQLHYELPRPSNSRSVLLVAPDDGVITAHCAGTLARCTAEELGLSVLLIDASPREPFASRMFDTAGAPGFADLLADPERPAADLALPTSHESVYFLPAGVIATPDLAGFTGAFASVLLRCTSAFDFVFLSGGPVLTDPVAVAISSFTGCVLLLAQENETRLEQVESAEKLIRFSSPKKFGLVLTRSVAEAAWE